MVLARRSRSTLGSDEIGQVARFVLPARSKGLKDLRRSDKPSD
jgi:hypothetical protein